MSQKNTALQIRESDSARQPETDKTARIAAAEDGKIVYASESFCTLSHLSLEQARALHIDEIVKLLKKGRSLSQIESGVHKVQVNGHEQPVDFHFDWLVAPDKKRYLIGSRAEEKKPSKKELKSAASQIWSFLKDNDNEQKNAQDSAAAELQALKAQLEAKEKELIRREKQLEEAESIGRMGHWYWKLGQDTLEWSSELFRMFGVSAEEFQPTLFGLNDMLHKSDVGRINQVFQRAMMEEKDYDMDFRINRPDGEMRYIRCEGRCAKDADGDVTALYGIMQDMTERVLYEQELRQERDRAERAYAAKSQFLANMSHELRTPLNAIIGFSEMMQRQLLGPIGTEKYLEYVESIHNSGAHLLDLISDILDMSKIEAGKYELDFQSVHIAEMIGKAVQMMQARAQEKTIALRVEKAPDAGLEIIADRRGVLQILLNLLSNAVKFTAASGHVTIECYEREDYLAVKIIDNGIGIPPNKLAQITKPFEQVSGSYTRDHEGSGLGLAITKELTEMHGGVLAIDSTPGVGTTVTVRLPYDASKAKKKKRR